ncbi:MAG: ABC transporter permease [Acidimicrobiia bacterium]
MAAIEERDADGRKRGIRAPWIMLGPGGLWLVLFYALPLVLLLKMSLSSASGGSDFSEFNADPVFNWHWSNFGDALSKYGEQFGRSFAYAGIATVAAMLIAFPIAYVIAFRGGRFKNVFLGLIIIPFLTNYLIRTLAWRTVVGDQSQIVEFLRTVKLTNLFAEVGITSNPRGLLRSHLAVVGGLVYNFLPFMILPIYVAMEKIDARLIDAARDLYANTWGAFRKVVVPLSLPGVFAGSLLVFIPAAGDFVNSEYLGGVKQKMIGNVVQSEFQLNQYPVAAALALVFMAIVMILVVTYSSILGTEDLT